MQPVLDTEVSGIKVIETGEYSGEAAIYDLHGCRVQSVENLNGVYIIRQGNRVAKRILRHGK